MCLYRCEQNQAQEAERQIHQEVQRLRDALLTEERLRLEALAAEEAQKIAALQELSGTIRQDVAGLRKLVESVKRETGNEDVPLLQVGSSFSTTTGQQRQAAFLHHLILLSVSEFPGFEKKVSSLSHSHAIVAILTLTGSLKPR